MATDLPGSEFTLPFSDRVRAASWCPLRALGRLVERVRAIERGDLRLVGEQDVDVGADQLQELSLWRSTQKGSDRLSATCRPALAAISAACRKAALASGRSNR
jgi:hypothetical protein